MSDMLPISSLFDFVKGSLQSSKNTPGKYTFITASAQWKTHCAYTHDCEALVFAMAASGSLGRTHYVSGKFIASDLCFILTPKNGLKLDLKFYHHLFNFIREDIVQKTATGTSKLAINRTNFGEHLIPFFDYEHQLAFRDQLEALVSIKEQFIASSEEQQSIIHALRQQILQEAIEGKLTIEWRKKNPHLLSGDNHASKLLERIKAEKKRLIDDDKIKKNKLAPAITEDEKPFEQPECWIWCRLEDLCSHISDIEHKMPQAVSNGVKFISAKDLLDDGTINFTKNVKFISEQDYSRLSRRVIPQKDDIIYSRIGACLGKARVVTVDEKFLVSYSCCVVRTLNPNLEFIHWLLESRVTLKQATRHTTKNSIPDLGLDRIKRFTVGLPPLAEQCVIIKRLSDIMSTLGALEAQISARHRQSEILIQSVFREAFTQQQPIASRSPA